MANTESPSTETLRALAESWLIGLRAERKSPQTLKSYADGVASFLDWLEQHPGTGFDRHALARWLGSLEDRGNAPATMRVRQLAVRRFSSWLVDEDELNVDPMRDVKPVKLDQPVIQPLTDAQLKALLATKTGRKFADVRDEAILRLMVETGMRAGEVVALTVTDVDKGAGTVLVRRGKGGKGRIVPISAPTLRAIDRWERTRRTHLLAGTQALWLGERGKGFTYDGLHKSLRMRAEAAGIEGFHPHLLRHTAAHRWLAAGGSEGGLMAVAGWTRPDMLLRYTRAKANERAISEARNLGLGDDL